MDYFDREALVNQIICGYTICEYCGASVLVHEPTPATKVKAQNLYKTALNDAILSDNSTFEQILQEMMSWGLWDKRREKEFNELPIKLEALKIELYQSFLNFKRKDTIKTALADVRRRENQLTRERDAYRFITAEGTAAAIKNKFLICESATTLDGKPLFPAGFEITSNTQIESLTQSYFNNRIDENILRSLCKNEPWRSIWNTGKFEGGVFGKPSSLLSNDQRMLMIWSKIYDSVQESPDCPPDEVLEDDDMFDGWMILNSRKRETEKKESHGFKPGDKFAGADEVYILAEDENAVARIEAMNSQQAKVIKQQRMRALESSGGILPEQHMPDSMVEIRNLAAQQLRNRRK